MARSRSPNSAVRSRASRTAAAHGGVLVAVIGLALAVASPAQAQRRDSRLVREGVALHNSGHYAAALANFQEAFRENAALTRLLPLMGACHFNLGRVEAALDLFERYEGAEPVLPVDDRARLRTYYQEAESRLREDLRTSPARAELHLLLGRALLGEDLPVDAFASLARYESSLPPGTAGADGRLRAAYGRLVPRLEGRLGADRRPALLLMLSRVHRALGHEAEAASYAARYQQAQPPPVRPAPVSPPPVRVAAERAQRPLWRLLAGGGLVLGGGMMGGFGISALAVDGACFTGTEGVPALPECAYEFDTRGVGAGLLVGGLAVTAAGVVLLSLPGPWRRGRR